MAARSDHIRLDAEHAARLEISKVLEKYKRRIYEDAKTHIARTITEAPAGSILDGSRVGEDAVAAVVARYLGVGDVQPALEAGTPDSGTPTDS